MQSAMGQGWCGVARPCHFLHPAAASDPPAIQVAMNAPSVHLPSSHPAPLHPSCASRQACARPPPSPAPWRPRRAATRCSPAASTRCRCAWAAVAGCAHACKAWRWHRRRDPHLHVSPPHAAVLLLPHCHPAVHHGRQERRAPDPQAQREQPQQLPHVKRAFVMAGRARCRA